MSVWDAWMVDNHQMSPSDPDCQLLTKTNCPNHYRHPLLDESTIDTFLASKQRVRINIIYYRYPLLDESRIDTFLASKQRVGINIFYYRHPLLDESTVDTFLASKQRVRINIFYYFTIGHDVSPIPSRVTYK